MSGSIKSSASFRKSRRRSASDPKKEEKEDERQQAQISDFFAPKASRIRAASDFAGQDVIVFDFGPNPDYKPRKLVESIVQKLVGVVWIDEEARDVARLEARFSETAKIGGGLLASLHKGTNLVIEQTKINGEVWLPSYAEVHATARVVFVRVRQNEIDRYSDYKKFRVETKIGPSTPWEDLPQYRDRKRLRSPNRLSMVQSASRIDTTVRPPRAGNSFWRTAQAACSSAISGWRRTKQPSARKCSAG